MYRNLRRLRTAAVAATVALTVAACSGGGRAPPDIPPLPQLAAPC